MPRLDRFEIEIETGEKGNAGPVQFRLNGHTLGFYGSEGGAESLGVFTGYFEPRSFAHNLVLLGPEGGSWDLTRVQVRFFCMGNEPYTVRYGAVQLNDQNALDLWQDPPLETFEV